MKNNRKKHHADWLSKTLAGFFLGFTLALALSGVFAWLGPGGIDAPNKVQFNMWIIAPLWLTTLSLCYLFPTGIRACAWLFSANLLSYSVLFFVRFI